MYGYGEGVPEDYREALKWYRMAAEQGYAPAQYNLGGMYIKGEGVPEDYREALKWYRMAAEQGLAEGSMVNLAFRVLRRQGRAGGLRESLCLGESCRRPGK